MRDPRFAIGRSAIRCLTLRPRWVMTRRHACGLPAAVVAPSMAMNRPTHPAAGAPAKTSANATPTAIPCAPTTDAHAVATRLHALIADAERIIHLLTDVDEESDVYEGAGDRPTPGVHAAFGNAVYSLLECFVDEARGVVREGRGG